MKNNINIEHFIKNILEEILNECDYRHIRVSADFISYYVNLLQLDPDRRLTLENIGNRYEVQKFVDYVIFTLGNQNDPTMFILRLQREFRSSIQKLNNKVQQYRKRLSDKLYPLMLDIIEQNNRNTGEKLYQKLSLYVTLASGLGNPDEKTVLQEVLRVLKSVLNPEEIRVFPTLQNYIKQEVIASLTDIVTGIRLYNKACKKGGEGMADLPALMKKTIPAVLVKLKFYLNETLERVKLLTQSITSQMIVVKRNDIEWGISFNFTTTEKKKKWLLQKDLLAAHRQLSKITRILLKSVTELDKNREMLQKEFDKTINDLNKIVVPTLHQAVSVVFPYFFHLANIWKAFQDDAVQLKEIFNIFKTQAKHLFRVEMYISLENEPSNFQTWAQTQDETLISKVPNYRVIVHHKTENFTKNSLEREKDAGRPLLPINALYEFYGYCCWILTHSGGVLIPASISLGVIEYKNKFYGFSTKMAANSFARDPDFYILKTMDLARKSIHLIKFLNLGEELKKRVHIKTLIQKEEPKIAVNDQQIQTDTHFEESRLDYTYCWNIWEYKRAAIRAKDLKTKVTRSCETDKTHQFEAKSSQTYSTESCWTQTKIDASQNTPKPLRFLYQLRGNKDNFFADLNLFN